MAGAKLNTFLRRLRQALHPAATESASDAQLLQRFVHGRDEQAFELLVWRHGLMVLNVCRRVLRHEHDAEDAFQAAFLALARKAGSIGKRQSVGSWLYKVAFRIALRIRGKPALQPLAEEDLSDPRRDNPISDILCREFAAAIDEEIARLPEKYRTAVILCHLEGQTLASAASVLACPPATVGTWLARARTLLRRRLTRRGFDASSLNGARNVVAVLSAALVHSTVRAACLGTVEEAAAAGAISASVASLTKGTLRVMSFTKWTTLLIVGLTLALLGGIAFLIHPSRAALFNGTPTAEIAAPPSGGKEIPRAGFRWKFRKGESFYQVMKTTTAEATAWVMNAEGERKNTNVTEKREWTFYFQWTPIEEKDGKWTLKQRIIGLAVDVKHGGEIIICPGGPSNYDSTKPGDDNSAAAQFYKALIGSEFKVTLSEDGKVQKVEGRDEVIKKLSSSQPKMMIVVLNRIFSEDAVRQIAATAFAALPAEPVGPGDSWARTSTLTLLPMGRFQTRWRCIYEGKKGKLDRITMEGATKHQPQAGEAAEGCFDVKRSTMKGKGTGALRFDREKGRGVRLELELKLEGTVTYVISGRDVVMKMSVTQETTVQTMDTNPIATKPRSEGDQAPPES